jgi:2-C-methyl-D-erythritol 4-phosphate cytidylyltransferase/2-C-methyl-D-erythritol 2,4-cyclodiphosphate synthase
MKLTHGEDFAIMEQLMAGVACVGTGFDAHRFGPGDHVTLCGVKIAHTRGVVGHSDADVGWHALTDALLGAIGAGDIGAHFPPSDAKWKGAASEIFLAHARDLVREAGGRIVHVDVTLVCEAPKISPHREAMRAKTAEVLGLPLARVSVKATTTEKMGFAGREEGLAAQAVATVETPR